MVTINAQFIFAIGVDLKGEIIQISQRFSPVRQQENLIIDQIFIYCGISLVYMGFSTLRMLLVLKRNVANS